MAELTKEYFDQTLKTLPNKQEVKQVVADAVEDLARIVNTGFQEQQKYLEQKLDVRERMNVLEKDMVPIKEALHIK